MLEPWKSKYAMNPANLNSNWSSTDGRKNVLWFFSTQKGILQEVAYNVTVTEEAWKEVVV